MEPHNEVGDAYAPGFGYQAVGVSAEHPERQNWTESAAVKTVDGQRCVTYCYWQMQAPNEMAATGAVDSVRCAKGAGADDAQDLPAAGSEWGS